MNFNEDMMQSVLNIASHEKQRRLLYFLRNDPIPTYRELQNLLNYENPNTKSGLFAHHLRSVVEVGLVKKDKNRYFLTRIGLEMLRVLDEFEKICTSFDLDDCDADGRVQLMVKRG